MSPFPKLRSSIAALSVLGVVVGGVAIVVSAARPAAAVSKVTICHRTHSTTNPYRRISVGMSAVNGSSTNDHTHHTGDPFQPGYSYPPNQKVWGDIIPNSSSGGAGSGLNAAHHPANDPADQHAHRLADHVAGRTSRPKPERAGVA